MKLLSLILTALICFISTHFLIAQDTWFWQNPLPQGNHLGKIIAADDNKLAASGLSGVFLLSTDNGLTWNISYITNDDNVFAAINLFYSKQNKKFYSLLQTRSAVNLLSSSDDGSSWYLVKSFTTDYIRDIHFIDGNKWLGISADNKIKYTSDAGSNWNIIDSSGSSLNAIRFFDSDTGIIAGSNGTILRTTDSGNSWKKIDTGVSEDLYTLRFYNSEFGIAAAQFNVILITTDAGLSWQSKKFQELNEPRVLLDLAVLNERDFIIVGGNDFYFGGPLSMVKRTSNGGTTWINISDKFQKGLRSIEYVNASNQCFAVGYAGGIYKTDGPDSNWRKIYPDYKHTFNILCTYDSSSFYLIGYERGSLDNTYKLIFTENGGESWEASQPGHRVGGIDFLNRDYGIMTFVDSVFKTTNGGKDWILLKSGFPFSHGHVSIVDEHNIFIFGENYDAGKMYKTSDSGITWQKVNCGANSIREVKFKDSLNGLIIQNFYEPLITSDGGETWSKVNFRWVQSGTFFGNNSIALGGSSGNILISKDGGISWKENKVDDPLHYISGVAFKDSLNGTAVGGIGYIFYTTDGGETWGKQLSPTAIDLLEIMYAKNGSGVITGKTGTILGTRPAAITGINIKSEIKYDDNYFLSQNYPNPFNPATTITFKISEADHVKLKVYDILGREVTVIVDENLNSGTYSYQLNAAELPSGVYFYQLQAGSFIQTKKMILLR